MSTRGLADEFFESQDVRPSPDAVPQEGLGRREKAALIGRIRTLMEFWSISPDDLCGDVPEVVPADPVEESPRPAKYRHPVTGETWDGAGSHPQWLRDALLKQGYTVDQLRAAATQAHDEPSTSSSSSLEG
jgi:DNA-binding protein H-NS